MLVRQGGFTDAYCMQQIKTDFLLEELLARKARNTSYSERAFARALGVSAAFLKLYLQRKRNLSAKRARIIASRLGWSERQTEQLIANLEGRKGQLKQGRGLSVPMENFRQISDWFHFAIVELLKIKGVWSKKSIAKRLNISVTEADYSLQTLEQNGLVKRQAEQYIPEKNYIVPLLPSSSVRKFHRQSFERAIDAIEGQTMQERELRSLTLAFDSSRKEEAAQMISAFVKKFEEKFSEGKFDRVYQLSLAFYGLDKGEK